MIITLDFETYYDRDFSLSKLTTEEYVRDDRFEVIGVGVKVDDGETEWCAGDVAGFLGQYDWDSNFVLAHNTLFDGAILSWRFGISPKGYLDTLCMARAIDNEASNSLAKLAERLGVGHKGNEVVMAMGKRRKDFSPEDLHRYGEYCRNDVELTYQIYNILKANFKLGELKLIDTTLRMFTNPTLQLNLPLLEQHLMEVKAKKEALLAKAEADKESLMSNQKFASMLIELGVDPPSKLSPTTGKPTLALAKNDEGFKALQDHPDERVQALVAARLGTKSTLEETRTERFISIAKRGSLPVPLRYYAAHTGRWGGDDKLNLQNLPRKSKLKEAICAPEGYVLIDADSSQIEARTVAWLAGQRDLVKAFENGEDVYKIMAAKIYHKSIDKIDEAERFVGKTTILGCIAEGTLVLCDSGWKPIEQVSLTDKLWDGEEWVCHQGLLNKGLKETLNLSGAWLTPDHQVLCGTQWLETQSVVADENTLSQALDTGAANLPLQATSPECEEEYTHLLSNVPVAFLNTRWNTITSKILNPPGATSVQNKQPMKNAIGCIPKLCLTINIEPDCSIDSLRQSLGAITSETLNTKTMEEEELQFAKSGATIGQRFLNTLKRLTDGITQPTKWTELITIPVMNPETSGLFLDPKISEIDEVLKNCKRKLKTYDLAYAGPRNRFTILTTKGPIIVHNCGYGMGWMKFKIQLKAFGVDMPDTMCQHIINTYRASFQSIPVLWEDAQKALDALASTDLRTWDFGYQPQAVSVLPGVGFDLPSGLPLKYMELEKIGEVTNKQGILVPQYQYTTRKGKTKIYGGKVVENVCQALARCVVGEQMLRIAKRYKVVLTVHDAVACIAKEEEQEEAAAYVQECMRWRPKWAETLPLNCEVKYGKSYGTTVKYKG